MYIIPKGAILLYENVYFWCVKCKLLRFYLSKIWTALGTQYF